jgi:hypothetical protein
MADPSGHSDTKLSDVRLGGTFTTAARLRARGAIGLNRGAVCLPAAGAAPYASAGWQLLCFWTIEILFVKGFVFVLERGQLALDKKVAHLGG